MKIYVRENSPRRLTIVLKPAGWIYWLAGLVFVALGVGAAWLLANRTTLSVAEGAVRYEKRLLGLVVVDEWTATASAEPVAETAIRVTLGPTMETTVRTRDGVKWTSFAAADGDAKEQMVAAINQALALPDGTYQYAEDKILPGAALAAVCLVGGLICWLAIQTVVLDADRGSGTLAVERRLRLVPIGDRREWPLDRFAGAAAQASTLSTGKHRVTSYQVVLVDVDGDEMGLARGPMFTAASANEVVALLTPWAKGAPRTGNKRKGR